MANDFYTHGTFPAANTQGSSAQMRAELDLISAGFDKLPSLTSNAYKLVSVNGAASALAASGVYTDSSGNLGVGTASPGARLEVSGSGNIVRFGDGTSTFNVRFKGPNNWSLQLDTSSDKFSVQRNSVDFLTVDSGGGVGLGTSTLSSSALLELSSTSKGLRLPNMTTTQKNAIGSPAAGLLVFDTTLGKACIYTGAAWQTITSS